MSKSRHLLVINASTRCPLPLRLGDSEFKLAFHGPSLLHDEATVFADLSIVASVQETSR